MKTKSKVSLASGSWSVFATHGGTSLGSVLETCINVICVVPVGTIS